MKIKAATLVALILIVITGCQSKRVPASTSSRPFTIHITNQSFYIERVDIKVSIDGEVITKGKFHVGKGVSRQHVYKSYTTALEPGTHTILIQSKKGETELIQEFEFTGTNAGVVSFWYSPEPHSESVKPKFTFETIEGPLMIVSIPNKALELTPFDTRFYARGWNPESALL